MTAASKVVFGPPSLVPEGLQELCVAEPLKVEGSGPFKKLRQRFRSDEGLADDLQSGDADALTELFQRHSGLLFGIARRVVRIDSDAEDVVQQTFLDIYRAIGQFDPAKGSFKTWLVMFAYHRAFNHRRAMHANRLFVSCDLEEILRLPVVANSPAEVRAVIDQVLNKLPLRERETIQLIYFGGFTAIEVAALTGQTVRVVRHNLYRGLEKLRVLLSGNDADRLAKGRGGTR